MTITRNLTQPLTRAITRSITQAGAGGASFDAIQAVTDAGGSVWTPYDMATLYQDAAGTTPVTSAGQTVKRISDVSGRGFHLTNATGDLYQEDADGNGYVDLSGATGSGWVTTSSAAAFKFLHDGTGGSLIMLFEKAAASSTQQVVRTGTVPGFLLEVQSTGMPVIEIKNAASATVATTFNSLRYPFGPGARRMNALTFSTADGLDLHADGNAASYASAAQTNTPSTASSNQSFFIGSTTKGKLFFLAAMPGVLTADQHEGFLSVLTQRERSIPAWNRAFAICGQSNAEGSGPITSAVEMPSLDVAMYDKSDRLRVASEPLHDRTNWVPTTLTGGSQFSGFGLRMAKDIATATATNPLLVPCAVGGTSMANWTPTGNRVDRLTLYGSMNARMAAVGASNPTADDPVFCWFGHEADASSTSETLSTGVMNTAYQQAFYNLMAQVRTDYPDSPIIFAQLAGSNTASASTRRAQEALRQCEASYGGLYSVPNSYMVVTHDVQRNVAVDDIHVSEAGQKVIGQRFALAYREHVLGEVVNGTGPRLVSITKDSASVIRVTFNKVVAASATDYGTLFRVYDGGVEATVSSAVRDAGDTDSILLTLSAPSAGVVVVTYTERNTSNGAARTDFVQDSDGLPAPAFGPVIAV